MKKFLLGFFVVLAVVLGGMWAASSSREVYAGDCDNNAVIKCGFTSQSQMKSLYKTNATKDLDDLYTRYGISAEMVNKGGKDGQVTKSGDVIVDGKVIATGARSVGRENMSGSTAFTAGGTKFYERSTNTSFRSNSLKAVVFTDQSGKFVAAVLYDCGNPVKATPKPVPVYQCTGLTVAAVAGSRTRYSFKASHSVKNATFKHYTYTVKSGGTVVKTMQGTSAVEYEQTKAGSYTVEATVTAVANGKTVTSPVGGCKGSFTIKPETQPPTPEYECTGLTSRLVSGSRYAFTLSYTVGGGAKLDKVSMNYGDNTGAKEVPLANLPTFEYEYAKSGAYDVTATLTFMVGQNATDVKTATCAAKIMPTPCPEKPELPADSPECVTPCPENPELPANSPDCKEPETPEVPEQLVNTGPGDIIGMVAATTVAGTVAHRLFWTRRFNQ